MKFFSNFTRRVLACFGKCASPHPSSANSSATSTSLVQDRKATAIDPLDINIGRKLGTGAFGSVYEAAVVHKEGGRNARLEGIDNLALKKISIKQTKQQGIENEVDIQQLVSGEQHVAQVYGSYRTDGFVFIAMEILRGGSLLQFLERNGPLCEKDALFIFEQVIKAVEGIHNLGISHLDIKPDNLMLAEKTVRASAAVVKLIDFGLAHRVRDGSGIYGKNLKERCGTPVYAAPEISGFKPISPGKCDIWSCGILLYELLTNSIPFSGSNFREVSRLVKWCGGDFDMPRGISASCAFILRTCLSESPERRPTAAQLLKMVQEARPGFVAIEKVRPNTDDLD